MKPPFLLAALLASSIVHAQHKHAHGEGRLDVAIDKIAPCEGMPRR